MYILFNYRNNSQPILEGYANFLGILEWILVGANKVYSVDVSTIQRGAIPKETTNQWIIADRTECELVLSPYQKENLCLLCSFRLDFFGQFFIWVLIVDAILK
jgi:hypothetical protein